MALDILRSLGISRKLYNDPFLKEGNQICQKLFERRPVVDLDDEDLLQNKLDQFTCSVPGCMRTFECVTAFEDHYNSQHQYTCITCKKNLPSPRLLELHITEHHDPFFQVLSSKQAMYRCLMESCSESFVDAQARRTHCVEVHKFPAHFRFDEWMGQSSKRSNQSSSSNLSTDGMEVEVGHASSSVINPSDPSTEIGAGGIAPSPSGCLTYRFSYHVPANFSFGHGASRGFMHRPARGRGRGRKHQTKGVPMTCAVRDSDCDVSKMDLSDLEAALPASCPSAAPLTFPTQEK